MVAHRPSCSEACGIFPDQGLNLCLLRWQVDFFTMEPPGKPSVILPSELHVLA